MKILSRSVTERLGWTTGSYAVAQAFRLVNNVVLARLLAPELFGIMLIVNTLRTGVELLSDIGIGQNIISNKNGEDPAFYNTAWVLQILRGILLAIICISFTYPISQFYNSQTIYKIVPVNSSKEWKVRSITALNGIQHKMPQKLIEFCNLLDFISNY